MTSTIALPSLSHAPDHLILELVALKLSVKMKQTKSEISQNNLGRISTLLFGLNLTITLQLILLLSLSLETNCQDDLSTLKLVQIIHRHGDREPDYTDDGVGKLTDIGKKQVYDLGQLVRNRYRSLISTTYDPDEVLFISSDKDRTIQSAELMTHGLYRDFNMAADWSGGGGDTDKILFEPIPIRTIPKDYDRFLRVTAPCPRRQELRKLGTAQTAANYGQNHSDLIDYYRRHNGEDLSVEIDGDWFSKFILRQDELIFNHTHNLPVPDWTLPLFEDDAYLRIHTSPSRLSMTRLEFRRLYTGSFVQVLRENLDRKIDNEDPRKMIVFSGHDRPMLCLLIALNLDDIRVPDMPTHAAALMVELHQDDIVDGNVPEHYLKIWYRNNRTSPPQFLQIPNCGPPCTIQKFRELTQELIPDDFQQECQLRNDTTETVKVSSFLKFGSDNQNISGSIAAGYASTAAVLAVLIVLTILISFSLRRKSSYQKV